MCKKKEKKEKNPFLMKKEKKSYVSKVNKKKKILKEK